jgi:lysophospholipase L1-like esterase
MRATGLAYYGRRFGLVLGIFAVLFGGPELVARWLDLKAGWSQRVDADECQQRSPTLLTEFVPNCRGALRGSRVDINSLGFRSPEIRRRSSTRILALGDSCTFGWNVRARDSYPAVLQVLLDRIHGKKRFEVINAGHPGYTAYHGAVLFAEKGLALEPDIVTVGFGFNALFRSGDIEERIAFEAGYPAVFRLDDLLMDHSRAYAWARWTLRPKAGSENAPRETPEKYGANLREIVAMARSKGAEVLFIDFLAEIRSPESTAIHNEMENVARELNVPVVPFTGPTIDIVHPTVKGYRMLASDVWRALDDEGWLGAR